MHILLGLSGSPRRVIPVGPELSVDSHCGSDSLQLVLTLGAEPVTLFIGD